MPTLRDSVSASSGTSTVSTLTASGITPAGSNRFGLVKVAFFPVATINSVTWGGTDITANVIKNAVHDGVNRKRLAWFYILDPPASAADVVVTLSTTVFDFFVLVEAWDDVDQTTPYDNLTATADNTGQTAVPASLTVSSASGDVVTDCYYQWTCSAPPATLDVGADQTSILEIDGSAAGNNGAAIGASYQAGAASVDMGWTNEAGSQWAMYAISLKPAAGAPVGEEVDITEGVSVDDQFSARAVASASITAGLEAGDTDAAAATAQAALSEIVTAEEQYAAIAAAAAAIQSGLESGETWAAVAAAAAGMTGGAEFGAVFSSEPVQQAALTAGTHAAADFVCAVAAFASMSQGASVSTAFSAVSASLAIISAAVVLGATFTASSTADVSVVGAAASVRAIRRISSVRAIRSGSVVHPVRPKATI